MIIDAFSKTMAAFNEWYDNIDSDHFRIFQSDSNTLKIYKLKEDHTRGDAVYIADYATINLKAEEFYKELNTNITGVYNIPEKKFEYIKLRFC